MVPLRGNFSMVIKIQKALEQAGIHFTDDEAGVGLQSDERIVVASAQTHRYSRPPFRRASEMKGSPARPMTAANDLAVRRALEAANVMFIDENWPGCAAAQAATKKRLATSRAEVRQRPAFGHRLARIETARLEKLPANGLI
jgi:hypothetical protein